MSVDGLVEHDAKLGIAWELARAACLADGATKLTFAARGKLGGEKVKIGGALLAPITFTLTSEWKQYSFSVAGTSCNTFETGLEGAIAWRIDPAQPATVIDFWLDDVRYVK